MTYEVLLKGSLSPSMGMHFEPMTAMVVDGGRTLLKGDLPDQASLFGLLARMRDLNIEIVELRQVKPDIV